MSLPTAHTYLSLCTCPKLTTCSPVLTPRRGSMPFFEGREVIMKGVISCNKTIYQPISEPWKDYVRYSNCCLVHVNQVKSTCAAGSTRRGRKIVKSQRQVFFCVILFSFEKNLFRNILCEQGERIKLIPYIFQRIKYAPTDFINLLIGLILSCNPYENYNWIGDKLCYIMCYNFIF